MLHKKIIVLIIMIIVALLLSACSIPYIKQAKAKGVYHRVKTGETLWQIARAYNISLQDLAEFNNITDPNIIKADSVLFIPDANQVIDDIMNSAKLTGVTAGTPKGEPVATPPDRVAVIPKAATKPPMIKSPKETDLIMDIRSKTTTSLIKEEDITHEPLTAKTALPMTESKAEQKIIPPDKRQAKPDLATVKEPPKVIVPLREKDEEIKTSLPIVDVSPLKEPEKMETQTKDAVGKAEPAVKPAIEGTISSGLQFDKKRFIWPLQGKVISRFGIQPNGMYLNGIKIAAKEGAPVSAAAAGTVIFSAALKGYGETVIIKHEDNFATVYTHLYDRMVSVEDRVKKGEKIALLGRFEQEGDPYLNFEIRQNNKARNPLFFLP
jgi:lipoprotein NlpD